MFKAIRIATFAAAASIAPFVGAAEEIIFGISASTGSLQQRAAAEFTSRVNKELAGKVEVKLFDSSQIGKDKELMQKLKLGTVHIALPSSIMSSISDQFALFDLPFLVADRDHLARIEEKVFWPQVAPTVEDDGYKVLAVWENGIRHISNNVRPIDTPADLAGVKIRTPKSKWRVIMFETWDQIRLRCRFQRYLLGCKLGSSMAKKIHTPIFLQQNLTKYKSICQSLVMCIHLHTQRWVKRHMTSLIQQFEMYW